MRCPKCHYLSFDPEPRCRNCGYDLSLADHDDLELDEGARSPAGSPAALGDFVLHDASGDGEADDLPGPASDDADDLAATRPRGRGRNRGGNRRPIVPEAAGDPDTSAARPLPAVAAAVAAETETAPDSAIARSADVHRFEPMKSRQILADAMPRETGDSPVARDGGLEQHLIDPGDGHGPANTFTPEAMSPWPVAAPAPAAGELPLFVRPQPVAAPEEIDTDEAPPVPVPTEVQAPLSVRRRVRETAPRDAPVRETRKLGPLDKDLLEDLQRLEMQERRQAAAEARAAARTPQGLDAAGVVDRLGAAAIDAAILGGLAAGLLVATLRWCDLPMTQFWVLPALPTGAFLLVVSLGYLLMFTAAGGQTLGKMVMGIRVVADVRDHSEDLTPRQAVVREVFAIPSVLACGLGFIPGLFGDQRAVHDRLAGTRVIRA